VKSFNEISFCVGDKPSGYMCWEGIGIRTGSAPETGICATPNELNVPTPRYSLEPGGVLWRSNLDGSERLRLTDPPLYPLEPRWSPDGKQIAFWTRGTGETPRLYMILADGGAQEQLLKRGPAPNEPDFNSDSYVFTDLVRMGSGAFLCALSLLTVPGARTVLLDCARLN
jgi:hypothetical protein